MMSMAKVQINVNKKKLSAKHYHNAICAKLQFDVQIYKVVCKSTNFPFLSEIKPFYYLIFSTNSAGVIPVIFWKFLTAVVYSYGL